MPIHKPFRTAFFTVLFTSGLFFNLSAQNSDDDEGTGIIPAKTAIMVRPLNALSGMLGISFERYITKGYSAVLYVDYIVNPFAMEGAFERMTKKSMETSYMNIDYKGYSIVPEVRKYFYSKDPDVTLVNTKEKGSLAGWFVGAYLPIRHLQLDMKISDTQYYNYAYQQDTASFQYKGTMVGFGIEGGKHWVWGRFSMEVMVGLAYSSGISSDQTFTYNRPGMGEYTVGTRSIAPVSTLSHWNPRFGVNFGIAF